MNRRAALAPGVLVVAALVLSPGAASAHLVQSGLGPFYDGLLHPLLSLDDLLPLLALAILAGLRGAAHARWLLLVAPLGWLAGFAASGALPAGPGVLVTIGALGVLLGVAGAADLRLPRSGVLLLGGLLGLAHGAVAGPAGGLPGAAGAAVAVGAVLAIVAGEVAALRIAWTRIAARVLASWTAAAGMLQLGWMLRAT